MPNPEVSVVMPHELKDRLRAAAKRNALSMSSWARSVLNAAIEYDERRRKEENNG